MKRKQQYRPPIHWTIKQEIWHMPCAACGRGGRTVIDHIIPISNGGTSERDNLQPLCCLCNGRKSNRPTSNDELRAWNKHKTGVGYRQ